MKLSLTTTVDADLVLTESLSAVSDDGLEVRFLERDGKLTQIVALTDIPAEPNLKIETGSQPLIAVGTESTPASFQRLVNLLRSIESNLSFQTQGALLRLNFQDAILRWHPETPEEEDMAEIRELPNWHYPRPTGAATRELLESLLTYRDAVEPLVVAKGFWREGRNDFLSGRYINAYSDFYLIVEGFYGKGQYKHSEVLKAFASFPELMLATEEVLVVINGTVNHQRALQTMLQARSLAADRLGFLDLAIHTRNQLSHFWEQSTRPQPTPFEQSEFESISWFLMLLAGTVIETKQRDLIASHKTSTGLCSEL
jgi:hypothetical protein